MCQRVETCFAGARTDVRMHRRLVVLGSFEKAPKQAREISDEVIKGGAFKNVLGQSRDVSMRCTFFSLLPTRANESRAHE